MGASLTAGARTVAAVLVLALYVFVIWAARRFLDDIDMPGFIVGCAVLGIADKLDRLDMGDVAAAVRLPSLGRAVRAASRRSATAWSPASRASSTCASMVVCMASYGIDDTRASLLHVGDPVHLRCKKEHQFFQPYAADGWANPCEAPPSPTASTSPTDRIECPGLRRCGCARSRAGRERRPGLRELRRQGDDHPPDRPPAPQPLLAGDAARLPAPLPARLRRPPGADPAQVVAVAGLGVRQGRRAARARQGRRGVASEGDREQVDRPGRRSTACPSTWPSSRARRWPTCRATTSRT
jgi:hypothetical protein